MWIQMSVGMEVVRRPEEEKVNIKDMQLVSKECDGGLAPGRSNEFRRNADEDTKEKRF